MTISACVPCYNNASTVGEAVRSLIAQTIPVKDVFVVDDGSTDESVARAAEAGARIVSMGSNRGRGAARAAAIDATQTNLLLSVDGTGKLAPDFLERALPWFGNAKVAAVYGRITQDVARNVAERWRGRHLYRNEEVHHPALSGSLITWAFISRPSAVREVGNFNASLRHSEDRELGERLLRAGWQIAYEPRALVTTLGSNSMAEVLERYWRWHEGIRPSFRAANYIRNAIYAVKVLVRRDLAKGDIPCALVSLYLPHYCAYRTLTSRKR